MDKRVNLVGCGPGGAAWVVPRAREAVEAADVVFGPSDLQALFPLARGARLDLPSRPEAAAPLVRASWERGLSCAVLVRGDCGLRSLAKGLQARLPPGACRRIPGVSSLQLACAVFDVDWEEACILSAHGREPGDPRGLPRPGAPVVVLGGGPGFASVLETFRASLARPRVHLASDLALPGETLRTVRGGEAVPFDLSSRTVAILLEEPS